MSYSEGDLKKDLENNEYEFGFVTDIESDKVSKGLNEEVITLISKKLHLHGIEQEVIQLLKGIEILCYTKMLAWMELKQVF